MTTPSFLDIPDTEDPIKDLIDFLELFELYNYNYISFAVSLNDYYQRVITTIDEKKVDLSDEQYDKYIVLVSNKLERLNMPKFPSKSELETAVEEYDDWSKIKGYSLKLFLFFSPESILYQHLNINFIQVDTMKNELGNKVTTLQTLFYQAAYNLSIKQIKAHLNNKIDLLEQEDYYPDIFKDSRYFMLFKDFIDNHLHKPHNDISFIYRKLKINDAIHNIKHLDFVNWLYDENFIDYDIKQMINEKGSFIILKYCTSKNREIIYEQLEDIYINS